MTLKSTQFYNFPLWEISDIQPLLDTVNDGTNKIDQAMAVEQTNITELSTKVDKIDQAMAVEQTNITELSTKVETNTDEILQLSNDLTNQVTAFKRLSNAITSFCHKRL